MLRHDSHAHVERFAILHKLSLLLSGSPEMVIGVAGERQNLLNICAAAIFLANMQTGKAFSYPFRLRQSCYGA
jgi:hypothetical protein